MNARSLVIGGVAVLTWVLAISAQSARPQPSAAPAQPARPPATAAPSQARNVATTVPATPTISSDEQRAFLKTWCVGCHNQAAAKAGIDSSRKL